MAHGFSATRDLRLDAYAERFCAAGIGALLFDYRHFGASAGEPRQLLDIRRQHADYRAAVAYARGLDWVDPDRVALFGSSFSGGHVIAVAAQDPRIAAVVSQCPFTDGLATLPKLGVLNAAQADARRAARPARSARRPAAVLHPGGRAAGVVRGHDHARTQSRASRRSCRPRRGGRTASRRGSRCGSPPTVPAGWRAKLALPGAVLRLRSGFTGAGGDDRQARLTGAARRDQALPGRPLRHLPATDLGARRRRPDGVPDPSPGRRPSARGTGGRAGRNLTRAAHGRAWPGDPRSCRATPSRCRAPQT